MEDEEKVNKYNENCSYIEELSSINNDLLDVAIKRAIEDYDVNSFDDIVLSDGEIDSVTRKQDEIYKKIIKLIKSSNSSKAIYKFKRKRLIALVASAVIMIITAVGGFAAKEYICKINPEYNGNVLNLKVKSVNDEIYKNINKYQYKDELIFPSWLPKDMKITELKDSELSVYFEYWNKSNDQYVCFSEQKIPDAQGGGYMTENNKVVVSDYMILGMDGKIVDITYETGMQVYDAIWCSDTVEYTLSTNFDESTFKNIIENLKYVK